MTTSLIYAHDPMCSWCWAFHPQWETIKSRVADDIETRIVLGGLAPDSDEPMPIAMQRYLQQTWQTISQQVPGTRFNTDFWQLCQPRRSTWPGCRAMLAADRQRLGGAEQMSLLIQRAYYLQARNPSDTETLIQLANEMQLDTIQFAHDLHSTQTRREHQRQRALCHHYGVNSYPSLVYLSHSQTHLINIDYNNANAVLSQLKRINNYAEKINPPHE